MKISDIINTEEAKYDNVHKGTNYGLGQRQVQDLKNLTYAFSKNFKIAVEESKNSLDIACGGGTVMNYVDELGCTPTGIDISSSAIEKVNSKFDTFVGSCHQLPFEDNKFDLVYFLDGMEHIPVQIELDSLKEAFRVSNRYVCHAIAMGSSMRDGVELHINRKSENEWRSLINSVAMEFGYKEDMFYVRNNTVYLIYKK